MSDFDRDRDWTPHLEDKKHEQALYSASNLRALSRAELSVSHVTGDEHWDSFLQLIQGRLEEKRSQRAQALTALEASNDFSADTLITQKLIVRQLGCEIEALEWVIELPKIIREQGERAKELLGTIDKTAH